MSLKPIVRWAGGKRWLLAQLRELVTERRFRAYHEPFLGGGAVFLGLDHWKHSYLSDLNHDLIEMYRVVRDKPQDVAYALGRHRNEEGHYYQLRAAQPVDEVERAARFIFLNHTSFNGVYRVNLKGEYNVPFGNRRHVRIPDKEHLEAVSARLAGSDIRVADFQDCLEYVEEGDLVFLDPPYTAAHNDNGFVKYNQKLFAFEDQIRLKGLIEEIRARKAFYIMTNADHMSIQQLFDFSDERSSVYRKNAVGGRQAKRGKTAELLLSNVRSPGELM